MFGILERKPLDIIKYCYKPIHLLSSVTRSLESDMTCPVHDTHKSQSQIWTLLKVHHYNIDINTWLNRKFQIKIQNIQKNNKSTFPFQAPPWSIHGIKVAAAACFLCSLELGSKSHHQVFARVKVATLSSQNWVCSGVHHKELGGKGHI